MRSLEKKKDASLDASQYRRSYKPCIVSIVPKARIFEANKMKLPKNSSRTIVDNNLINDCSVSPECRWLIIFLICSQEEGEVIHIPQLVQSLKLHIGRDKVYLLIREGIKAGYIQRETYLEQGKKRYSYSASQSRYAKGRE